MTPRQITKAKGRLEVLHRELASVGAMMRGSIVTNGRRHPQPYLSLNKDRRTHLIYLGEHRLPIAKTLTQNYAKLITITEEMTVLNMQLLKNDAIE